MAINFIKKEDLSHITRTTRQWETTIDRYEVIPKGVLCIELCNDKLTKIKIGNGHLIYEQLPYVSDVNLSDYYTKEETNTLLKNLKSIKIKGEASSLSDLPLRGNEEGDLWFVKKPDPDTHNRYDEYVWYNNKWESFGSSDIDLSEYAKKSYVDEHIQEVQNEITEIIESGYLHKHNNKNILDQTSAVYNRDKDDKLSDLHNYDDTELREKAHTHLNKNILDQTDAVYNRDKDDKLASLHNYDDTSVKERISTLESVSHSHSNQDVLNRTTAAFTKEQALTLLDCKDFKGTDGVHSGYHGFVPAPTKDDVGKVLGANGEWVEGGSSGGDTITEGGGIEITTDSQTGVKTVSVNAGTGLEIDQQTGELNVTATGGDTIAEGNGIDITTDSQTGVKTISVDIGDGLQFNQNSEIDINTGDGLSVNQNNALDINTGEGLQINQNNELEVSLGNGLFINNNNAIELDKATTTTIGGVIVGDNLSIDNTGTLSADEYTPGEGISIDSNKEVSVKYNSNGLSINASDELELDKATKNSIGGVIVGDNINVSNGTISVPIATDSSLGVVKPTDGLLVDNTGELSVNTGDGLSINQDNEIEINIGEGLQFNQNNELEVGIGDGLSINASDEVELDKATTSSIGGVIIGDNIDVNNGTISVPKAASNKLGVVKPSDGLSVDSNGVLTVDTGDGLSIDSSTKDVNVNVGRALTINQNNDIDVDIASNSAYGCVKIGEGIDVDQYGIISVDKMVPFRAGDGLELVDESVRLPSGYAKVKYVENPSGAAIAAPFNPRSCPNAKVAVKFSRTSLSSSGNIEYVFGAEIYVYGGRYFNLGFFNKTAGTLPLYAGFVYGSNTWNTQTDANGGRSTDIDIGDIIYAECSVGEGLKMNNEQIHNVTNVGSESLPYIDLGVFANRRRVDQYTIYTENCFVGRIYSFKIYNGKNVILNLIPAVRLSDNVVGFYSHTNNTFYPSITEIPFTTDMETLDIEVPDWVMNVTPATTNTIGGIKVGEGLSIDENNVVSSTVYEEGQGIIFETSGSTDSFNVKNKEYYFDYQVNCQINGNFGPRTYTRVSTDEPCIAAIIQTKDENNSTIWTNPIFIGLTETACQYTNSYDQRTIGPNTTFSYKGYTWYVTSDYGLMNSTGVDLNGHLVGPLNFKTYSLSDSMVEVSKAVIDLAELISPGIKTYDVWNSGTGWLNGAYNDSQSDQFWTNWYYTYHSKPDEYLEVPAGAVKMRLIGISNENDSRLQGGGVDCFDSSHHHFASVGCVTDEWFDIPGGTVYLQFGVKWNESNNRYISSSDIKSVTLEIKVPKNNAITAKLGDGLTFDENDAITLDESIKLIIHCVGDPLT